MRKKNSKKASDKRDRPKFRVTVFIAFLIALIADQVTKFIASVLGAVTLNPGISFGLLSGPWLTILLVVFFILFFEWTCPTWQKKYPIAMGLLLGGAMSNIVDRIVVNGVRDFLSIPFTQMQNNLADWLIVFSLGYIMLREIIGAWN